ncbi:MAG: hypothetical protein QOH91_1539 [Mycobacterium sp.]|jgi:hypothetical protein|nr:hypothetical protein [Mycobacterium sp.]
MAKVKAIDPDGVRWSVYRRWGFEYWHSREDATGGEDTTASLIIDLLQSW